MTKKLPRGSFLRIFFKIFKKFFKFITHFLKFVDLYYERP